MNKLLISFFIIFTYFSCLYSQQTNDAMQINTSNATNDILKSRLFFTERDKLTSKMNIYTSWKDTYKYLRDNRFRFYKRVGRTITLEFRYKYPGQIFVNRGTPIIFTFDDGSTVQLSNIQKVIYNPFMMGDLRFYDVEVRYKFNDDAEFESFASRPISNIRFNFVNEFNEETYDDIYISPLATTNWQMVFSAYRDGIAKLEELQQQATNTVNTNQTAVTNN